MTFTTSKVAAVAAATALAISGATGVANAIVEHDYLNGESIRMDGALRMAPR